MNNKEKNLLINLKIMNLLANNSAVDEVLKLKKEFKDKIKEEETKAKDKAKISDKTKGGKDAKKI